MPIGINEFEILKESVEPDVYIVDKILPPGVTLLCGHQKIGKSWLALKLCLCATRGVNLCFFHASRQKGLSHAVSDLAFTSGDPPRGFVKPQAIGKTVAMPPFLDGAITGAISVGHISPEILRGRPSFVMMDSRRGEDITTNTQSRRS